MDKTKSGGLTTLEYAILLPVIMACVLVAIDVYLVLYQRSVIQNLAEDSAQSLAMQWGYDPLPVNEMKTGVYQKATYESREVYWHLKLWRNDEKEAAAEQTIQAEAARLNLLKPYEPLNPSPSATTNTSGDPEVDVAFVPGFPSTVHVKIKATFYLPGAGLLKTIGLGGLLSIEGNAQTQVYDAKDMINNTDYVLQLLMNTGIYQKFMEKLTPLKENLDKLIKE